MQKSVKEKWQKRVLTDERKDYAKCKRRVYRVFADPAETDVSDRELMEAFNALDNRKCDEVTVWFYRSQEEVQQGLAYTVAMIERTGRRAAPALIRR
ncbi:hypothetical protein [Clostridium sp. D33t1_170424_F3]|uniref:hypothetical protein n=1 Tax=Clostridium sp. D33t1_170424_F3 TaxID=2787099 RepID=UPI0018AB220D|nr:hypothetical protein [Clostridium sp. D33t1_170424_F3]